jgi:hypothetical protein
MGQTPLTSRLGLVHATPSILTVALDDIMQAYDTFEHAAREGALKVILSNDARG